MAVSVAGLVVEVDGKQAIVSLKQLRSEMKFTGAEGARMAAQVAGAMGTIETAAKRAAIAQAAAATTAASTAQNASRSAKQLQEQIIALAGPSQKAQKALMGVLGAHQQLMAAQTPKQLIQSYINGAQAVTNFAMAANQAGPATAAAARGVNTLHTAVQRLSRTMLSFRTLFTFFTGAGAFGIVAHSMLTMADSMKMTAARLQLVNKGFTSSMQIQRDLFNIAQQGRTEYEATANLFVRLAGAAQTAGYSYDQLLAFTDAVNKAFLISGSTAKEASNALIQLGQVISSNRFQGDELRSLFENFPGFVQALEKGSGKTRDELRKLAAESQLTGKQIVQWLLNAKDFLDQAATTIPRTFGQAVTQLRNDWAAFIYALDRRLSATPGVVNLIDRIRKMLQDPKFLNSVSQFADKLGNVFMIMINNAETILRVMASIKATSMALAIPGNAWMKLAYAILAIAGVNIFFDSLEGADKLKAELMDINEQISNLENRQFNPRAYAGQPNARESFESQKQGALRELEARRDLVMRQIAAEANSANMLLSSGGLTDFDDFETIDPGKTLDEELKKRTAERIMDLKNELEFERLLTNGRTESVAAMEAVEDALEAERIIRDLGIDTKSMEAQEIRELIYEIQQEKLERELLDAELAAQMEVYETLDEVKKAAIDTSEQFMSAEEKLDQTLKELHDQVKFGGLEWAKYEKAVAAAKREALDANPIFSDLNEGAQDTGKALADAFFGAASGAMTFSEAIADLGARVIDLLYDLLIVQPLMRSIEEFMYGMAGAGTGGGGGFGKTDAMGVFGTVLNWGATLFGFGGSGMNSLGTSLISGSGPGMTSAQLLNFGGAKAAGGSVGSGAAYLVGEQGPELFVPGTAGTIVPNRKRRYDEADWISLIANLVGKREMGGPVNPLTPYMVGEKGPELYVPGRGVRSGITGGGASRAIVNHFTIVTPDPSSFRSSQGQIMNTATRAMSKSLKRDA